MLASISMQPFIFNALRIRWAHLGLSDKYFCPFGTPLIIGGSATDPDHAYLELSFHLNWQRSYSMVQ